MSKLTNFTLKDKFIMATFALGTLASAGGVSLLLDPPSKPANGVTIEVQKEKDERKKNVGYGHLTGGAVFFAAWAILNRRKRPGEA